MRTLIIHPEAVEEVSDAALHYQSADAGISARFLAETYASIEKARSQPLVYRCFDDVFRKVRVTRFPYAMIFRLVGDDRIQVLSVMHLHREPGYWKLRSSNAP